MRVAHLTTVDLSLARLLAPQLQAVIDRGDEAIGISAPGPYVEELEAMGVRHIALHSSTRGRNARADMKAAVELWRILRRERPDVLHTHNPKPGLYGRIVGRLAGVPTVVNTVHGFYATEEDPRAFRGVVYGLEAFAALFSDVELYQSVEDVAVAQRLRLVPDTKLQLLGNGIDLDRFDPERTRTSRDDLRDELGLPEDQIVVGVVGRLVAGKGYRELIRAAELLPSNYTVLAIGPLDAEKVDAIGPAEMDDARQHGLMWIGERNDVERIYPAMDLFVLPSHREGFPRAAMEAAAAGLPVIATDIRGCRQVVDDGVNGRLVELGDVDALVEAIRAFGDDEQLRAEAGAASLRKARAEFDQRGIVDQVMASYGPPAHETPPNDVVTRPRRKPVQQAIMRLLDLVLASTALAVLAPFLAVLATVIRVRQGPNVLFRQTRAGLDGTPFTIFKFRTMSDERDGDGRLLSDHARISRLGRFLRHTSLDEIPQLINVVRGDMSLVGPRPLYVAYVEHYNPHHAQRLAVRPGITGWAAVNGRDAASWQERLDLEAWYAEHWTLALNISILLRTVRLVVAREGIDESVHDKWPDFDELNAA